MTQDDKQELRPEDIPEGTTLAALVELGTAAKELRAALLASVPLEGVLERMASVLVKTIRSIQEPLSRWLHKEE